MAHRGPDGSGYLDAGHVVLAHRRLAVIDPTPAGHQPMRGADGSSAIVYNGELYNEPQLRAGLERAGHRFRTSSDTETLIAALRQWGTGALRRLRGMYAFGFHDAVSQRLLLARDPLGIKPLYYWRGMHAGAPTVVFASEIPPILGHPAATPRPDLVTVSAYLTTIRTTLGERTLFDGVRVLQPGEWIEFDLSSDSLAALHGHIAPSDIPSIATAESDGGGVRAAIESSIRAHLRSDVPICCLLSGGLDSTIVASVARRELDELWTYCSGAPSDASGETPSLDDFAAARVAADHLGTRHAEAPVDRAMFISRWQEMVAAMGLPLSTPNEVAINEVARRLRADGKIVTISGEGADELFGGYELPMRGAHEFEASLTASSDTHGASWTEQRALLQTNHAAWVPISAKPAIFHEPIARAIEGDAALLSFYARELDRLEHEGVNEHPAQRHLRFQRRINLTGLLQRLDSATMLASVEGRTPFADIAVVRRAESLPMAWKFVLGAAINGQPACPSRTKIALREAFAGVIPEAILQRPKASFPLPFQAWCGDAAHLLSQSALARELFTEAAISTVASRPTDVWPLAWPMINIAMWGRRWWE